MSTWTLVCAMLLATSPAPRTSAPATPPRYSVQLRLVEQHSAGTRHTLAPPPLSLQEGQARCVQQEDESVGSLSRQLPEGERSQSFWIVHLDRTSAGRLRIHVTIHRNGVEKCVKKGVVVSGPAMTVMQFVEPGKTSRVVLGRAPGAKEVCWLEINVEPQPTTEPPPLAEEEQSIEPDRPLYRPFWFEPF